MAEIGPLFRDLRRALHVPLPALARQLATRIEVLQALETGDTQRLPPWPETARVVTAYTALGAIDPNPVLSLLRAHVPSGGPKPPARAPAPAPSRKDHARGHAPALQTALTSSFSAVAGRLSGAARAARAGSVLVLKQRVGRRGILTLGGLCLAIFAYIAHSAAADTILAPSSPVARISRVIEDYVLWQRAPVREGLRWIEVDDPRSRRSDRL